MKRKNDRKKKRWLKSIQLTVILCIVCPILLLSIYYLTVPFEESVSIQKAKYNSFVDAIYTVLYERLNAIDSAVTLVEDSASIRAQLEDYCTGKAMPETPQSLVSATGMPLSTIQLVSGPVQAVGVFSDKLAYVASVDFDTERHQDNLTMAYQAFEAQQEKQGFLVLQAQSGMVYWSQPYTNIYSGAQYGRIVVELPQVNSSTIQNSFAYPTRLRHSVDLSAYEGTQFYAYDSSGTVFFSSAANSIGFQIKSALPDEVVLDDGRLQTSGSYQVTEHYLSNAHLNLCVITPSASVYSISSGLLTHNLWSSVIVLLLAILLMLLATRPFFSQCNQLVEYCQSTQEDEEPPLPAFTARYPEMKDICDALYQNRKEIVRLNKTLQDSALKIRDAEIKSLQNQINPHFLFNVLDTLRWKVEQNNTVGIGDIIDGLGDILHNNIMFSDKNEITISQELEYIRNYLNLQKIRFPDRFDYSIECDDDILNFLMPKLSLQPIVENSVVHGVVPCRRPGFIHIQIWEEVDCIMCRVTDNGDGFDAESVLRKQQEVAADVHAKHHHIALCNIQNRIKLNYGESYGLTIVSEPGCGAEITLTFPLLLQ